MRRLSVTRILSPVVVVLALVAVYALATFTHPITMAVSQPAPVRGVDVTSVVSVCPSPGMNAGAGVGLFAASGGTKPGQAVVARLGDPAQSLYTVSQPGQLSVTGVKVAPKPAKAPVHSASPSPSPSPTPSGRPVATGTGRGGVVVRAAGAMARGLEVEQAAGSVPTARCVTPGTDFWFVGPGQHAAARIELYLMNPANVAADVSVQIATDAGPMLGTPDTGIPVAPHSMVVQHLSGALRGSRAISLHVSTSVGQVAAAVEEVAGGPASAVWLPATQEPARTVIVPGLPGTAGTRDLYVSVPGTVDARLRLTAISTRGSYQPTAGGVLDIPGGAAVDLSLPSLGGIPAALKLSANVPVTASAMIPGGPTAAPGLITSGAWPVQQQGVIAMNRGGGGTISQLVLSAPGRAVSARIWRGTSAATGVTKDVQVPAGHSMVVQLGRVPGLSRKDTFAVLVTPLPGSGQLYAGQVMESSSAGNVLSLLPVLSSPTIVRLPAVQHVFIGNQR